MATVTFANLVETFAFQLATYTVYSGGSIDVRNAARWSWRTENGHDVDLSGSGLVFGGPGGDTPSGGTLTQLMLDLGDDDFDAPDVHITGLSVAATALAPLVSGMLTSDMKENLFWRVMLAGDDDIDFTAYARNDRISFAADGRNVANGQTLFGGDDTVTGSFGSNGEVYGDYRVVGSAGSAYGGDDVMNASGDGIYGDFFHVAAFGFGGDDTITVESDKTFGSVYGDAQGVAAGALLSGGDDTITILGSAADVAAMGDVAFVNGHLIGGRDTIINGNQGVILVGDAYLVDATGEMEGGDDTIWGGGGGDAIFGDWGAVADGGVAIGGDDKLFGEAGNDLIHGNGGDDLLDGGIGPDELFGDAGVDTLIGGLGKDVLDGGSVPDPASQGNFMLGGDGDDTYHVRNTYDLVDEGYVFPIFGFGGFDEVISHANWFWDVYGIGEKLIIAEDADDPSGAGTTIVGGVFDNAIIGNSKTNIMFGRGGADEFYAGDGIDYISLSLMGVPEDLYDGVDGVNTIVVEERASGTMSYDIVFEFESGKDKLDVSSYGYASAAEVFARGVDAGDNSYFALGDGFYYVYMVGLNLSELSAGDFVV